MFALPLAAEEGTDLASVLSGDKPLLYLILVVALVALAFAGLFAREVLSAEQGPQKMRDIMEAQGASPLRAGPGSLGMEATAERDGRVESIDCLRIATVARLAGAPTDAGAGIELFHRIGDVVRKGDPLYRVYASDPSDFAFAAEAAGAESGFRVAAP